MSLNNYAYSQRQSTTSSNNDNNKTIFNTCMESNTTHLLKCKSCNNILTENIDAIQCSGLCNEWLHIECASISKSQYKVIKTIRNLHWCCNECNVNKNNANTLQENNDTRINELLTKVTKVEEICKTLKNEVAYIKNAIDEQNKQSMTKTINNTKLHETGSINNNHKPYHEYEYKSQIRLYGLTEQTGNNVSDRMEKEFEAINKILAFLKLERIQILNLQRIGSFYQDRCRTLVISLNSIWDARLILAAANNLFNYEIKGLFLRPNLSISDLRIEKIILKKRWELIKSGVPKKSLKIKGLKLYRDDNEISVDLKETLST